MGTFKGAPKTKEQIKAQDADRARRKANQPLPELKLVEADIEPPEKEGIIARVRKKRKSKKKKSKEQEVEQVDQESGE